MRVWVNSPSCTPVEKEIIKGLKREDKKKEWRKERKKETREMEVRKTDSQERKKMYEKRRNIYIFKEEKNEGKEKGVS